MSGQRTLVLHAPSVHTGGGFVLLQALIASWPGDVQLTALLDARAHGHVRLPGGAQITWVDATAGARLKAEIHLSSLAKANDLILCFHGLPPLFSSQAKIVVFLQNRLYLAPKLPSGYRLKTYFRLTLERFVSRIFRHRVAEYFVQTPSMQRAVLQWYGARGSSKPVVTVLPFVELTSPPPEHGGRTLTWDFVYVADGEAHKNHRTLLAAWQLLAREGLHPSLALTLSSRDTVLRQELHALTDKAGLRIKDLGQMPHENVLSLYSTAKAMIFPSTSESFGLPLIEAMHAGLPILASELDYVRDVCRPAQTFDPNSPVSIARAVKRFLGVPEPVLPVHTPHDFLRKLFGVAFE